MISIFSFARFADRLRAGLNEETLSDAQARDLGLCLTEARAFARARPGVHDQMMRMARQFGLAERDVKRDHWRAVDAARVCSNCTKSAACSRFLRGKTGYFKAADCPNAGLYSELAKEVHAAA